MVTAGVSVVAAVGVSVVEPVPLLDVALPVAVPLLAPLPPVLAIVPEAGPRTITARATQTLFCSLLLPLPVWPLPVRRLEFMWRKVEPGKHCANTVTRAPVARPFTLAAAPVVVEPLVLLDEPVLPELLPVEPVVPPVPPVVVAVAIGVSVAAGLAVAAGLPVAVAAEALLDDPVLLELLDEPVPVLPLLLLLTLPPVLVMKPVAPQPHIRVLARSR